MDRAPTRTGRPARGCRRRGRGGRPFPRHGARSAHPRGAYRRTGRRRHARRHCAGARDRRGHRGRRRPALSSDGCRPVGDRGTARLAGHPDAMIALIALQSYLVPGPNGERHRRMGSLTVRNIGDDVKQQLRLRAARNGRSVEEEIRHILAAAGTAASASIAPTSTARPAAAALAQTSSESARAVIRSLAGARILLITGGGIAAYKALDLIRRLKERGATVRVVMTKAAQEFITPLSVGAIAGERPYIDLF